MNGNRFTALSSNIWRAVDAFAFRPASPIPLAVLRLGLAAALIAQAIFISPLLFELYGKYGIMQGAINDFFGVGLPNIGTVTKAFALVGIGDQMALVTFAMIYLFSLVALFVGFYTRAASIVAWFCHLVFSQGHTTSYGVDTFASIFLFYLMWMPCGNALSFDRALDRVSDEPTSLARLSLRVLQLHVCMVYLSSGLDKARGAQWWDGDAIWRSLVLPVYAQMDLTWVSHIPWLAMALGWGTLLIEIAYPFMIFPTKTRKLWVLLTISLHVGIGIFLGLHLFAIVMATLTFAMFGVSAEPRKATAELTQNDINLRVSPMRSAI